MSFFFGDGFDLYALPQDAAAGYWDSTPTFSSCNLQLGRFSGSRAMNMGGAPAGTKTSGINDSVHHFTFAYMQTSNTTSSNTGFYITLFDGATAQCTVGIRGDGLIMLLSGTQTGTVLATYAAPPAVANVWTAYEIELVVHNTNGSMTIRKNGNINNDFYSGLFNTRNSANNYANKMSFGYYQGIGGSVYIDDFLWRSEASTVPWVGDVRCYTRHPVSDVVAQFSRTSASVDVVLWAGVNIGQNFNSTWADYIQIIAPYSGLLNAIKIAQRIGDAIGIGSIKTAVFSNLNNTVGAVLAVANELVNPPSGNTNYTLTFSSPLYVTAGQIYWVGVIQNSVNTPFNVGGPSGPYAITSYFITNSVYSSWPVSNPIGTTTTNNCHALTLSITPQANADSVGELQQDLSTSYVYSSLNGQNDLYAIGSIGAVPASVVGVTTRGFFEKSDSGTRNATVQLKSGGTTVQGVDTALVTATWNWISRIDLIDPATSAAWTATAVNSVQIGPKVTA